VSDCDSSTYSRDVRGDDHDDCGGGLDDALRDGRDVHTAAAVDIRHRPLVVRTGQSHMPNPLALACASCACSLACLLR